MADIARAILSALSEEEGVGTVRGRGRGDGAVHRYPEKVVRETCFLLGLSPQTGLYSTIWGKRAAEQTP